MIGSSRVRIAHSIAHGRSQKLGRAVHTGPAEPYARDRASRAVSRRMRSF